MYLLDNIFKEKQWFMSLLVMFKNNKITNMKYYIKCDKKHIILILLLLIIFLWSLLVLRYLYQNI